MKTALRIQCWVGLFLVASFLGMGSTVCALDIYLIRHAESMGNVTGDYSEENQNTFSPKGLEQVAGVPEKLKGYTFDKILVSPTWRTQMTILPYLKAAQLKAEIFPEIEELDCGIHGNETPSESLSRETPVQIVAEGQDCFTETPDLLRYDPRNKEDGLAILQLGVELLKEQFGGTEASILLVTHSCTGGRLLELLLGLKPKGMLSPNNAALSHLRQKDDGTFELLMYNDEPITPFQKTLLFGFDAGVLPGFINLAGTWKLAQGDNAEWAMEELDDADFLDTEVPGGWEKDALPDYDGVAWYRLKFTVTPEQKAAWGAAPLVLILGAVDDAEETFLNGHRIGAMGKFSPEKVTAWNQPRLYPVPGEWLSENNVLAVRVDDWGGGGGIWRGPVALGPAAALNALAP